MGITLTEDASRTSQQGGLQASLDVVCVGAVLMDIIARTRRHPEDEQEAFVDALEQAPGGSAANTAAACARLGLRAGFVGRVGADAFGEALLSNFREVGVDVRGVVRDPERASGVCYVAVDARGKRRMYAHSGAANALESTDIDAGYLRSARVVHLADLRNLEPLAAAARLARGHATVSLNPGGLIVSRGIDAVRPLLRCIDLYISSEDEAAWLWGEPAPEALLRAILAEGVGTAVLTRGARGCIAASGKERVEVPAFSVKAVDTTGAGDAFSAGFLFGLVRGLGLRECCRWGAAAAARCVEGRGARLRVGREGVEELIKRY